MKYLSTKFITIFLIVIFSLSIANAQEQDSQSFKHSLNMCPLAVAFGIVSVNYEYLITPNHGIVARLDYESIPDTYSDAKIEVDGKAAILNYRYHFSGQMESFYLGAFSRYRIFSGDGKLNDTTFDFDITEFSLGLNAGKKWVWNNGFNINFTLGYGYTFSDQKESNSSTDVKKAIKVFKDDYAFIDAFLGEFSIGYAF